MIEVGSRFGTLQVTALRRGAKNAHSIAVCRCDCGESRAVRQSSLRRGLIAKCASCARKAAWASRERNSAAERAQLERESEYKSNARRKRVPWNLSREQFRALINAPCWYCGKSPAGGVDRTENALGYTMANAVPCCSTCNYAKRDMPLAEFLSWVGRVFRHARP